MKAKVLGVQSVDYVSKRTNQPVKGVTLHCSFKDAQVSGEAVDGIFVSENLGIGCISEIKPGMMVDVQYNSRGFVVDVSIPR